MTPREADSSRVWAEGLIWSVAAGWLIALVFGTVYNAIIARRAAGLF